MPACHAWAVSRWRCGGGCSEELGRSSVRLRALRLNTQVAPSQRDKSYAWKLRKENGRACKAAQGESLFDSYAESEAEEGLQEQKTDLKRSDLRETRVRAKRCTENLPIRKARD